MTPEPDPLVPESKPTPPLQEILDAQGYLIITSDKLWEPGSLMPSASSGPLRYGDIPGPLAVIGMTDYSEWRRQCLRFNHREPDPNRMRKFFYKVVVE